MNGLSFGYALEMIFLILDFLLKKVVFNYFFCNFVAIMIIKFYCYEKS